MRRILGIAVFAAMACGSALGQQPGDIISTSGSGGTGQAGADCGAIQHAADERDFAERSARLKACGKDYECQKAVVEEFNQRKFERLADNSICQSENKKRMLQGRAEVRCKLDQDTADLDADIEKTKAIKACNHHDAVCQAAPMKAYSAKRRANAQAYSQCLRAQTPKMDAPKPTPTRTPLSGKAVENTSGTGGGYGGDTGKSVPPFRGTVPYGGVTLTVQSFSPMLVGQGQAGKVKAVSKPARYNWAMGFLTATNKFQITRLIDLSGNEVAVNPPIDVDIAPK